VSPVRGLPRSARVGPASRARRGPRPALQPPRARRADHGARHARLQTSTATAPRAPRACSRCFARVAATRSSATAAPQTLGAGRGGHACTQAPLLDVWCPAPPGARWLLWHPEDGWTLPLIPIDGVTSSLIAGLQPLNAYNLSNARQGKAPTCRGECATIPQRVVNYASVRRARGPWQGWGDGRGRSVVATRPCALRHACRAPHLGAHVAALHGIDCGPSLRAACLLLSRRTVAMALARNVSAASKSSERGQADPVQCRVGTQRWPCLLALCSTHRASPWACARRVHMPTSASASSLDQTRTRGRARTHIRVHAQSRSH
jgi:hypothetical protein